MKALCWNGKNDVRVETVPDPTLLNPRDAIVRVTSTAICGSDLHLMEVLGPFIGTGDVLGHEPMGIVEEVGSAVTNIRPGDRVVVVSAGNFGERWVSMATAYGLDADVIRYEWGETPSADDLTALAEYLAGL